MENLELKIYKTLLESMDLKKGNLKNFIGLVAPNQRALVMAMFLGHYEAPVFKELPIVVNLHNTIQKITGLDFDALNQRVYARNVRRRTIYVRHSFGEEHQESLWELRRNIADLPMEDAERLVAAFTGSKGEHMVCADWETYEHESEVNLEVYQKAQKNSFLDTCEEVFRARYK